MHGLSDTASISIRSYLNNWKQRVNVNNIFSYRESAPRGSILETLNFADDNMFCCFGDSISDVNKKRKSDFVLVIYCFYENCICFKMLVSVTICVLVKTQKVLFSILAIKPMIIANRKLH